MATKTPKNPAKKVATKKQATKKPNQPGPLAPIMEGLSWPIKLKAVSTGILQKELDRRIALEHKVEELPTNVLTNELARRREEFNKSLAQQMDDL